MMRVFKKIKLIYSNVIKENLFQIHALTEKNIRLKLRYKFQVIISFVNPILTILIPLIIFGQFFQFNESFDISPWTPENFLVFQFVAYNIMLLKNVIEEYPEQFYKEKFWKTLPALIIAPVNRFNLLLSIFFSHLILISIPFTVFFIICFLYYPISLLTVFFIIIIYFLITLIFCGMGLIISVFTASNEDIWRVLYFILKVIFWASCITYPFQIFPSFIQQFINLNPLYYVFDVLRIAWIHNNFLLTVNFLNTHFIILILLAIIIPGIGVYIFNNIIKKYGIVDY